MAQIPSRCHGLNPQRVFRRRELPVQTYEGPDAYVANTTDSRTGTKMAPKVPPQFDGQDLIDDWLRLSITALDADKQLVGAV